MIWMSYLNHKNVFGIGMPSTWQDVFFRGRPGPRKKARGFTDFFVILLAFYHFLCYNGRGLECDCNAP